MIQSITYSGFIKKAFDSKAMATNAKKLADEVLLDPEVSGIDLVVIAPRDIIGMAGKELLNAVNNKHPKVRVLYLFSKDKENLDFESEVRAVQAKKVTLDIIQEAVNRSLEGLEVSDHQVSVVSKDHNPQNMASSKEKLGGFFGRKQKARPPIPDSPIRRRNNSEDLIEHETGNAGHRVRQGGNSGEVQLEKAERGAAVAVAESPEEMVIPSQEENHLVPLEEEVKKPITEQSSITGDQAVGLQKAVEAHMQLPGSSTAEPIEERVKNVQRYSDWDAFKHHLQRDTVLREVIHENTQFAGAMNMLEVLDRQIYAVFSDTSRSFDNKMTEIRELALNRVTLKDQQNNVIVSKLCTIMSAIVTTMENTVEHRIMSLKNQFQEVSNVNLYAQDRSRIQKLIEDRLIIQTELQEIIMGILNTYKLIDDTVNETVNEMDTGLPTDNAYINEVLKPLHTIFTPQSAGNLTSKLLHQLSTHRESLAALEVKIKETVTLVYQLCDIDTRIIDYQQQHIRLLEANRIEDVIITDTILKTSLRLFTGLEGTGVHSTAITISGVQSRQRNTLLIDLTGNQHFDMYNMSYIPLDVLKEAKPKNPFLCVSGEVGNVLELRELIGVLNEMTHYYPNIHVILTNNQIEYLKVLGETALAINYVCNASPESLEAVSEIVRNFDIPNVARKAVLIDADDPLWLLAELNLDPLTTKLVTIPHLTKMKTCSLRGITPYHDTDIAQAYEMAFK